MEFEAPKFVHLLTQVLMYPLKTEAVNYRAFDRSRVQNVIDVTTTEPTLRPGKDAAIRRDPLNKDDERYKSQSLKAEDRIRELILSGELAAGSDHLETELAERLGMSRTPVREATLMLEAQGLLEVRPRKGVRILSLSADDMREIYEILTELECLAAALIAAAGYSTEQLATLKHYVEEMELSVLALDLERWAKADHAFHDELVRLSGNSRIVSVVGMFNNQVRRAQSMTLHIRPLPHRSNKDHRALYEAISEGNVEKARQIHWLHRREALELLTGLLERHQLRRL